MKNKIIQLVVCSLVTLIFIPALSYATVTTLDPKLDSDCTKLNALHTMLVVDATWCEYCQAFLPVVAAVSNLPAYKS